MQDKFRFVVKIPESPEYEIYVKTEKYHNWLLANIGECGDKWDQCVFKHWPRDTASATILFKNEEDKIWFLMSN